MIPSVIPKLIIELREDEAVAAIVGDRVRSPMPAPGDADWDDFEDGQRKYRRAFVVLRALTPPSRHLRLPVQFPRYVALCFGRSWVEATELRWAVSNALHNIGPRVHANGLGIYNTWEDGGGEPVADPDTGQPYEEVVFGAIATTQPVTA